MVEKIDKTGMAAAPWTIKPAVGSQQRQSGGQQPSPESEGDEFRRDWEEFSSPGTPDGWKKFHRDDGTHQLLTLETAHISHMWFRKVTLKRQLAILEVDIAQKDGAMLRAAKLLLPRFDEYFQLKGFAVGQEIAPFLITHGGAIEVSVPTRVESAATHAKISSKTTTASPANARQSTPWWALWNPTTQSVRPTGVLGLAVLFAIVVILAVWLL